VGNAAIWEMHLPFASPTSAKAWASGPWPALVLNQSKKKFEVVNEINYIRLL
jgi:hypothetical protein